MYIELFLGTYFGGILNALFMIWVPSRSSESNVLAREVFRHAIVGCVRRLPGA